MSAEMEPDHALAKWREQIEENRRLQHTIEDQRTQIEELARLNHQALFEANRFKAIGEAAAAERDYFHRGMLQLRAKLETIGAVAGDAATSLANLSTLALEASLARPDPVNTTDQKNPPTSAEEAVARVGAMLAAHGEAAPAEDDGEPVPAFLTAPRTPLPEVRP